MYIYKGFVGFTEDNVLIAFDRFITEADIEKYNIRDGVCCSPVLIQNGEPLDYADFGEAESLNPRTAIGQRADGAVLFLTIDGRIPNSLGASCQDIIDIMLEFGAVTAANLDGGASSAMYYLDTYGRYGTAGNYVLMNTRSVLYNPRGIPTYFMVKP
jgi:exopolysaccharide biosynthesis protein